MPKKLLCFLVALGLVMSLASCGNGKKSDTSAKKTTVGSEDVQAGQKLEEIDFSDGKLIFLDTVTEERNALICNDKLLWGLDSGRTIKTTLSTDGSSYRTQPFFKADDNLTKLINERSLSLAKVICVDEKTSDCYLVCYERNSSELTDCIARYNLDSGKFDVLFEDNKDINFFSVDEKELYFSDNKIYSILKAPHTTEKQAGAILDISTGKVEPIVFNSPKGANGPKTLDQYILRLSLKDYNLYELEGFGFFGTIADKKGNEIEGNFTPLFKCGSPVVKDNTVYYPVCYSKDEDKGLYTYKLVKMDVDKVKSDPKYTYKLDETIDRGYEYAGELVKGPETSIDSYENEFNVYSYGNDIYCIDISENGDDGNSRYVNGFVYNTESGKTLKIENLRVVDGITFVALKDSYATNGLEVVRIEGKKGSQKADFSSENKNKIFIGSY